MHFNYALFGFLHRKYIFFSKYRKCRLIFIDILSVHCCTVFFKVCLRALCAFIRQTTGNEGKERWRMQQRSLAGHEPEMLQFMLGTLTLRPPGHHGFNGSLFMTSGTHICGKYSKRNVDLLRYSWSFQSHTRPQDPV